MTATLNTPATNTEFEGVVHVDPKSLTLEDNVRTITAAEQAKIDGFTKSAAEIGIYTPLTGVRDELGNIMIRDGQCRLRAALAAEVATVPVLIRRDDRVGDAREIGRRTEQLLANSAIAMRDDDVTATIDQLAAFGVPVEQIAVHANLDHERVAATVATAGRETLRNKVVEYQLTLDQANAMTEFEDDESALHQLAEAAQHEQFAHKLQELRRERKDEADRAAAEQPYRDKGVHILRYRPYGYSSAPDGKTYRELDDLITATGQTATIDDVTPEHLAVLIERRETYTVIETGEQVSSYQIDRYAGEPDHDGNPRPVREGKYSYEQVETATVWQVTYAATTDAKADKLTKRPKALSKKDTTTDDADKAAAQLAEAKAQASHERAVGIDLSVAADDAEVVRREHLTQLLARKTAPKGTAKFIAETIANGAGGKRIGIDGGMIARDLLGLDIRNTVRAQLSKATEQRAQVIALAHAVAAYESGYTRKSWRDNPTSLKPYLDFLTAATGYAPAPVECVILGTATADEVYAERTKKPAEDQPAE
ncbi:hypothetical protein GCM10009551_054260 [Nocardiopsis tropica]|uniref:ParB/Srx family N-terminal domain-containing protein n=1 Tax=Tsukamurella strandjordii TaxID=147577 RepID=UPI0031DBF5FF